ncbi:MAG: SPOR domain-containing protein [Nitrosomonadales bacterium]|nr:SPOR domain-containing protein [Nitrosomonadales bacterium]
MTKWIVGLLLLANLGLFGWMRWGGALTVDADAALAQTALNPDKVKLLEYLPASAVSPASSVAPGVPLPLSPPPAVPLPMLAQTPASVSVPAAASLPEPPAPVALTPHSAPVATPLPEEAKVIPPKLSSCAEWGEFSGSDLVLAQEALATLKLGDDLSQRTVEQNHGYWVYFPPQKNRAEVEKKIAQLKERGVKDYFVVQEKGSWLNAISLGVFKSEEAAQKYLTTLRAKGVRTAKIGERKSKLKSTIFLVKALDSGTADKLDALQKDFPDSELKVLACED